MADETTPPEEKTEAEKKKEADYIAFAIAFYDPTSLTFGDKVAAYMAVHPDCTHRPNAIRQANRWIEHPIVKARREAMILAAKKGGNLTIEEYIQLGLDDYKKFRDRGKPGDALAAAKLFEMVGKAIGAFTVKVKVEDARAPQISGEELADKLMERMERLARLRSADPTRPALPPGNEIEADFTIEGGDHEPAGARADRAGEDGGA